MSDTKKPVQGDTEGNLEYRLRLVAWRRKNRRKKEVDPPKIEEAPPEEDRRSSIEKAYNRSADELEKMGE